MELRPLLALIGVAGVSSLLPRIAPASAPAPAVRPPNARALWMSEGLGEEGVAAPLTPEEEEDQRELQRQAQWQAEYKQAMLDANERRRVQRGQLPTKVAGVVLTLGLFAATLTVFDPGNCAFLAPVKEVCEPR